MIWKLQKKTLLPLQIFGYGITLCIGITIVLTTLNIYNDIHPILEEETDMFGNNSVVISKNISIIESGTGAYRSSQGKDVDRSSIYFDKEEIEELKIQDFVEKIDYFNRASGFSVYIDIQEIGLRTDLFLESIPDEYLEIDSEDWRWQKDNNFIPIIMPKDWLKLLNLAYGETKNASSIPLLSYSFVKSLPPSNIDIQSSNGEWHRFTCSIVGFSENINTILVPNKFLLWANKEYGDGKENLPNKILVEFNDPSNPKIIKYLEDNDYEINEQDLEFNKLINIFKIAFIFVFLIAIIIIILSVAFILLSINLIFQKNKEVLINLYFLGYQIKQISYYYKLLISIVTLFSISISLIATLMVRELYLESLSTLLQDFEISNTFIYANVMIISVLLLILLNILIERKIRNLILR